MKRVSKSVLIMVAVFSNNVSRGGSISLDGRQRFLPAMPVST